MPRLFPTPCVSPVAVFSSIPACGSPDTEHRHHNRLPISISSRTTTDRRAKEHEVRLVGVCRPFWRGGGRLLSAGSDSPVSIDC
ncbi:MAG: hypothetical protein DMF98_06370 [Acidobacteria bacterium]|nr:MAG: hypothetical protein DMF98_06370 [Acidobacteriota bacterium]